MSAPKAGDRVSVSYEALYERAARGTVGHVVRIKGDEDGGEYTVCSVPASATVEVIVPPIKVGDICDTLDKVSQLPPWSIVARSGEHGLACQRKSNGRWELVGIDGQTGPPVWHDAVVLRIGGGS